MTNITDEERAAAAFDKHKRSLTTAYIGDNTDSPPPAAVAADAYMLPAWMTAGGKVVVDGIEYHKDEFGRLRHLGGGERTGLGDAAYATHKVVLRDQWQRPR